MATIKSYTDLEQSKKLAEILPFESTDMCLTFVNNMWNPVWGKADDIYQLHKNNYEPDYTKDEYIDFDEYEPKVVPCWSLATLSEFILPYIADDNGNNYKFYLSKDGLDRWIAYYKSGDVSIYICEESDNMIDVIFEMVCWLKKEEYI